MAFIGKSSIPEILATTYGEQYLAPHERALAEFWNEITAFPDGGGQIGKQRDFEIVTGDSHAAGAVSEGADLPLFNAPSSIIATVLGVEVAASVAWSDLMLTLGTAPGTVAKVEVLDRYVKMTVRNFYSMLNRHALGHSTGRMAVVQDATDTLTTFVCRNPESFYQLRKGMTIDFYDTDTGGTKQGATETISAINPETRTVTIGNARTLTAGWGVYKTVSATVADYGKGFWGLRAVADDGNLAATIFGITRSSNPTTKATVLSAGAASARQSYSDKLVRKGLNRIFMNFGIEGEEIWCNRGIVAEHFNYTTPNRIFQSGGQNEDGSKIGNKRLPVFVHNGKDIPFRVDSDLPNGEFLTITKSLFRKHCPKKPNWIGDDVGADGSPRPVLLQAPGAGTSTYALQKIAGLHGVVQAAHAQPGANVRTTQVLDEEFAGDTSA